MTNLQHIIDRIIQDGENEAQSIINSADKEGKQFRDEKIRLAEEEVSSILARAEREAKDVENQAASTANIRARDAVLAAKGELINEVLERILQSLIEMDDETYLQFLQNRLNDWDLTGKEQLVVPKDKYELVQTLQIAMEVSHNEFVDSGFIIKDDRITRNQTFPSIISYYKTDLQMKIAQLLFNE